MQAAGSDHRSHAHKAPPPYAAGALRKGCRHNPPCSVRLGCAQLSRHPFGIRRPIKRTLVSPWDPPFSFVVFSARIRRYMRSRRLATGKRELSTRTLLRTWDSPVFFSIPPAWGGIPLPGFGGQPPGDLYLKLFTCRCAALSQRSSCRTNYDEGHIETFAKPRVLLNKKPSATACASSAPSAAPVGIACKAVRSLRSSGSTVKGWRRIVSLHIPLDVLRLFPVFPCIRLICGYPSGSPAPGRVPCGPASELRCHCTWDSPLSSAIRDSCPVWLALFSFHL